MTVVEQNGVSMRSGGVSGQPAFSRGPRGSLLHPPPKPPVGGFTKRAFDLVVAGSALLFILPLLVVVAILVRTTSKGPALFWSERDDNRGGTFLMPKFRTMTMNAPVQPREQFVEADACITPLGRFLRKSSIDELPQLIPVLTGRMSLIGPRPLLPHDPAVLQRRRLASGATARPGITGLAQIKGRNAVSPRRKARYDQFYAGHWSWAIDACILYRTVKVVISRSGVM